jgi:Spy/CpxP family protein refolding chaperone
MMRPMRGMMGHGGMMLQRHLEWLSQQLKLNDEQRTQVQSLLRTHAKDVIRLQAEINTMTLDVPPLLEANPVDLAKVKQLFQAIAAKEADLRLAHVTAMQDIRKLLTPEQQKQFRTMPGHMMGDDAMMGPSGMMGRGGMMGPGGMMGRGGMMGHGPRHRHDGP